MGAKSPKNKEARKLLIKEILWKKYLEMIIKKKNGYEILFKFYFIM